MQELLLLGVIITFGTTDGQTMQMTLSLSKSSTVSLVWGEQTHTSSVSSRRHHFDGLATPMTQPVAYRIEGPFGRLATSEVQPLGGDLRIGLYGDSRDGQGPHRVLVEQMQKADLHMLVHTGDVVPRAGIPLAWVQHLASALPLSRQTPMIFALGNHELYPPPGGSPVNALEQAMTEIPPPKDALAARFRVAPATYHVRLNDTLFIALDSNAPLGRGTPQHRFLEAVLEKHRDAKHRLVAAHHGARSSGPHGPHPDGDDLVATFRKFGVTASLAGHDHLYERIVQDGVTYIVSGGGGAPLYPHRAETPGSQAFASTHNWVLLETKDEGLVSQAFSLESALLDTASLSSPPEISTPSRRQGWGYVGMGLFMSGCIWALGRLVRRRPRL